MTFLFFFLSVLLLRGNAIDKTNISYRKSDCLLRKYTERVFSIYSLIKNSDYFYPIFLDKNNFEKNVFSYPFKK